MTSSALSTGSETLSRALALPTSLGASKGKWSPSPREQNTMVEKARSIGSASNLLDIPEGVLPIGVALELVIVRGDTPFADATTMPATPKHPFRAELRHPLKSVETVTGDGQMPQREAHWAVQALASAEAHELPKLGPSWGGKSGGPWTSTQVQCCQGHIMMCPLFSWVMCGTRGSLVGDQEIPRKISKCRW